MRWGRDDLMNADRCHVSATMEGRKEEMIPNINGEEK
jgi:hypothetical protein